MDDSRAVIRQGAAIDAFQIFFAKEQQRIVPQPGGLSLDAFAGNAT